MFRQPDETGYRQHVLHDVFQQALDIDCAAFNGEFSIAC
jgi:hypothetical protein